MLSLAALALCACSSDPAPVAPAPAPSVLAADLIDDAIARGRALLDEGDAVAAEAEFQSAAEAEGNSFRTHMWMLRAWMDQGRLNDVLDVLDELRVGGLSGADLEYTYGMAFGRRVQNLLVSAPGSQAIAMNLMDAQAKLESVCAQDPERYRDAHAMLALCAWYNQDLEASREAVERALDYYADAPSVWFQLGRTALSQYAGLAADESAAQTADAHWTRAKQGFQGAIERFGDPTDAVSVGGLAAAAVQLAYTHLWKGESEPAAAALVLALGWDPSAVDYGQFLGQFERELYLDSLNAGALSYAERYGTEHPGDASAQWWIGWVSWDTGKNEEAEAAFLSSVQKWPAFLNCWYYLYRVRFSQADYGGSIAALHENWAGDPANLIASVLAGGDVERELLDWLVGWAAGEGQLEESIFVTELQCELWPQDEWLWNNLGLFLRDSTEATYGRSTRGKDEDTAALMMERYARSLEAYEHALRAAPGHPVFLNDGAVLLDYYLQRDYDRAMDMYRQASETVDEWLARDDLGSQERDALLLAKRDSGNNMRILAHKLERVRAGESGEDVDEDESGDGDR